MNECIILNKSLRDERNFMIENVGWKLRSQSSGKLQKVNNEIEATSFLTFGFNMFMVIDQSFQNVIIFFFGSFFINYYITTWALLIKVLIIVWNSIFNPYPWIVRKNPKSGSCVSIIFGKSSKFGSTIDAISNATTSNANTLWIVTSWRVNFGT